MVVSWPWPSMESEPVTLWAEMSEPPLLMWVVMSPVMALSSMSPWLAVMLTGALMAVIFTSPWLAVTVVAAAAGRVMVRSARAPSMPGTLRMTLLPLALMLGLSRWALAVGVGVGAGVDLFVDGDVDLVVVAGAGDRDVAAGIVDLKGGAGGEGLGEGLVALVFVAEELVEVVLIDVEAVEESCCGRRCGCR